MLLGGVRVTVRVRVRLRSSAGFIFANEPGCAADRRDDVSAPVDSEVPGSRS